MIKCSCADNCVSSESGCNVQRLSLLLSSRNVKVWFYFVMMKQRWSLNIEHFLQIDVIVTPKDFIIPGMYASGFKTFLIFCIFSLFVFGNNTWHSKIKLILMSVTSRIHTKIYFFFLPSKAWTDVSSGWPIHVVKNIKNSVCMAIENMSVKCCGSG